MAEDGLLATVVVVNYNGARLLPDCLRALERQTLAGRFRTVVVDNASVDDSLALLARDFPAVEVIASPANTGFAGGNNLALEHVSTPYAVLLNNDATPEPDWLAELLAVLEDPAHERVAAVTSKVLFLPRFLPVRLETEGFVPGPADTRELGVRVLGVGVDGTPVAAAALWEALTYGPEGTGDARYWWTRPAGTMSLPLPGVTGRTTATDVTLTLTLAAERTKTVRLAWDGGGAEVEVGPDPAEVRVTVPAGTAVADVVNNVGGLLLPAGYGADRGYQQVDDGSSTSPWRCSPPAAPRCAFRTVAGREVGLFDERFFLYYEDTDLSWRLRTRGWRYATPPARWCATSTPPPPGSAPRSGCSTSSATGC